MEKQISKQNPSALPLLSYFYFSSSLSVYNHQGLNILECIEMVQNSSAQE